MMLNLQDTREYLGSVLDDIKRGYITPDEGIEEIEIIYLVLESQERQYQEDMANEYDS